MPASMLHAVSFCACLGLVPLDVQHLQLAGLGRQGSPPATLCHVQASSAADSDEDWEDGFTEALLLRLKRSKV